VASRRVETPQNTTPTGDDCAPPMTCASSDLRVGSEGVTAEEVGMAYIISRNSQFYVVVYDGIDPRTNKERRRWHAAGRLRADAEAIAERITAERDGARDGPRPH
jgi:hypothetical protein